ncbi:hypothetical protein GOV09_02770 [Candidatus Woesearchaeota archaeon]|nr:hypothetical protein [Candidatus Woesearchaeota archaeon]
MKKVIVLLIASMVLLSACQILFPEKKVALPPPAPAPPEPVVEKPRLPEITLQKDNEVNTTIEIFDLEPICKYGEHGVELHFKVETVPEDILIQVKEAGKKYETYIDRKGVYEKYIYIAICEDCPARDWDFRLDFNKSYILRARFNQMPAYHRYDYSNEYFINTTPDSEYMTPVCEEYIKIARW